MGAAIAPQHGLATFLLINAKHATDISLNQIITFGTPVALATPKETIPRN